jgi:two-component system, NarL family, invasion response regulator UvrY
MIKILIADDHTLVRKGIRRMLEEQPDFKIVAEAADGKDTLVKARETQPDVILMDVAMPGLDGMEATKQLSKNKKPKIRILVLTMYADEHFAARLLRSGAMGYVVKDAAPAELVDAIRTVHEGKRYISSSLREALAMRYVEGQAADPVDVLTDREFQVLRLLASGQTNREIAEALGLSVKTVDAHRLNILGKLELRNNSDLTKFAIRHGIVTG